MTALPVPVQLVTPAFLLTSLVMVAAPGTGALYTVTAGLLRGRRAALLAAAACTLGILPHLVAAVSGLAALLHASPIAYALLTWAGIGYLLFMARGTWRTPGSALTDGLGAETAAVTGRRVVRDGIVLNLLNPKLTIFFVAFLPQFAPGSGASSTAVLGVVFMVLTLVVFAAYGVAATVLRPALLTRPRLAGAANRVFAVFYAGLAVALAAGQLSG